MVNLFGTLFKYENGHMKDIKYKCNKMVLLSKKRKC